MTDTTIPPNSEAAPTPDAPPAGWLGEWMPEELRAHAAAKGWDKAPDVNAALIEAVKSQRAAEQRLGVPADKLLRLPDQIDGEWWSKNGGALGVPAKPEDYQIERPTLPDGLPWDEGFEKQAVTALHAAGAPPHVVNAAVKFYADQTKAAFEADQAALHGARETMMGELKAEWGASADAKVETAKQAFQHFAKTTGAQGPAAEGLASRVAQAVGGDAAMIRMFHAIGAAMGEDSLKGGGAGSGGPLTTPADLQAEIKSIRDSKEYLQNPSAFAGRMEGLYKALAAAQKRGG